MEFLADPNWLCVNMAFRSRGIAGMSYTKGCMYLRRWSDAGTVQYIQKTVSLHPGTSFLFPRTFDSSLLSVQYTDPVSFIPNLQLLILIELRI